MTLYVKNILGACVKIEDLDQPAHPTVSSGSMCPMSIL